MAGRVFDKLQEQWVDKLDLTRVMSLFLAIYSSLLLRKRCSQFVLGHDSKSLPVVAAVVR